MVSKNMVFLVLSKPPYEVNETGWGEFEIQIKVYFMDPVERPVRLLNLLLYGLIHVFNLNFLHR